MMTTTRTVSEIIELDNKGEKGSPLPLHVISNYTGINLCSVESLTWTRQEDGQLVNLTINFIPATEQEKSEQNWAANRPA